jgi:formylglycine-generating enzyme required for sulfatase activity
VAAFKASQMLVSNGEYLQFVLEGGYHTPEWWTEEGQRWIASVKPSMPLFWHKEGEEYKLRTLYRLIDMPWDWPAEVNNL